MQGKLSLRERLVMLMVAAVLPIFALSIWLAARESGDRIRMVQSQLLMSAALLAANQDRTVDAVEQLLGALAGMPELSRANRSRDRCQPYFEKLRNRFPMYSNLGLLGPEGEVVCHSNGRLGDASAADRAYFREAVAQRQFVVGEQIVGRLSGLRAIPFASPVIEGDEVTGVVFATLDLDQASAALATVHLPPGARAMVADRHGRVLMEFPLREGRPVPRQLTHTAISVASQNRSSGVGLDVDANGQKRVYAYAPGRLVGGEGLIVRVGIARASAAASDFGPLRDVFAVLGAAMLAALAATWWLGGRVIVKPAKQILGTVRRLEQGSLDARVPLQSGTQRGEFARIGAAFNLMADSLQMRQRDLEAELDRSRGAYAVLDVVLNGMQEGLLAVTATGEFLMFNEAAARLFPLNGPPLLPEQWPQHFGIYHADGTTLYAADDLPIIRSTLGESGQQKLLFVRYALVPQGRLLQCSWQPIRSDGAISGGLVVFTDVTELQRLQAEQASQLDRLNQTQRKLIEAQRIGRVGNWELDLRTGTLWWSDEVYELFGIARERVHPTLNEFAQLVHPDDRALLKPARDSALRDGKLIEVEFRVIRPDGKIAWMHEVSEARRDERGEPIWYGGMVQDITNRKVSEQALLESERELQAYTLMLQRAAEAAHDITAHPSLAQTLRAVGDQARRVIGTRSARVSLSGFAEAGAGMESSSGEDLLAPSAEQTLAVALVRRNGERIGQLRLSGKEDGEFTQRDRYVAMQLAQLASIAIQNVALFTQVRDLNAGLEARITERTAELTRQEQLYRTLAEQAPEVVWNTDAKGAVTFVNRAWYELVGGQPGERLGETWLSALHPDDVEAVRANWAVSRQTLQPYSGTRRFMGKDGSYHTMSYRAAPVLDAHGKVEFWVGIDADITAFKAIEAALRSSNQELEAFSYSVSHDLRAPLGAIAGFSRALTLKLEGQTDERVHHYLERIRLGVDKMEQLIESLLSLAKVVRAPLTYGEVDLGAIARDILEDVRMQHPQRQVAVEVQDQLLAQGDERLLRLVMENLLGNAWKFTSRTASAVIEVGRLANGNVFFVRDNGVGFDMAYAGKLFGAFQRLHTQAEFPGTGIGLATVRRVVSRHQGRVWAESRPGEGTTFFFELSETAPPAWLAGQEPNADLPDQAGANRQMPSSPR
ncbi:MAG: putative histidine kinase, classic [Ramlibacter sp.]|nr:putative histidine kinase, classic [Ramlibacter sp.]